MSANLSRIIGWRTDPQSPSLKIFVCLPDLCANLTYMLVRRLSCLCWKEGDGVTASRADWLTRAAISCQRLERHYSMIMQLVHDQFPVGLTSGISKP